MSSETFFQVLLSVLTTLGGATVIVFAFAHFLGKVWTDRIAKQTMAKYDQELEILKSKHTATLEQLRWKADIDLKEREHFSGISKEVYQDFFKQRINTYRKLLELKNKYISDMHEDFSVDQMEAWGLAYNSIYVEFREVLVANQLYISNELEKTFHELRTQASKYIKEADMVEALAFDSGSKVPWEASQDVFNKFANETNEFMRKLIRQIDLDVSKLRSRVDLDKPL